MGGEGVNGAMFECALLAFEDPFCLPKNYFAIDVLFETLHSLKG